MNPLFDQVFNQQNINQNYTQQIQANQHHTEQCQEIAKAVKAIHDYCSAARKISPEYQQAATWEILNAIAVEMSQR